jgi:hypothetical protein
MKRLEKRVRATFSGGHHSIDGNALFGQTIPEQTNKNLKFVLSIALIG